jgi:putative flippase GtrA
MRPGVHSAAAAEFRLARGFVSDHAGLLAWLVRFVTKPGRMRELVRYTGASGLALALDTSIFLALMWVALLPASVAAAVGYLSGAMLHYVLSVRYIFAAEKTGKSHQRMVCEFVGTGLLGLLLTVIVIRLTVDGMALAPLIGKALSTGIAFLAVYIVRAGIVLASPDATDAAARLSPQHDVSG